MVVRLLRLADNFLECKGSLASYIPVGVEA